MTKALSSTIAGGSTRFGFSSFDTLDLRILSAQYKELERAIQLKPNYATAHHWLRVEP